MSHKSMNATRNATANTLFPFLSHISLVCSACSWTLFPAIFLSGGVVCPSVRQSVCLSVCLSICLLSAATQILLKFLVRFSVKLIFIRLLGHNQIAEACTLNSKKASTIFIRTLVDIYLYTHIYMYISVHVCIHLPKYMFLYVYIFNLISGANASAIQIPEPCLGFLFFFVWKGVVSIPHASHIPDCQSAHN